MRDLDDLGTAFAVLEHQADSFPLDLTVAHRAARPNRARRAGLVMGAVAAVAATAIAVASMASTTAHPHKPAGPGAAATSSDTGWTQLPTGHYLVILDKLPGAEIRSVIGVGNEKTLIPQFPTDYQEIQVNSSEGGFVFKVNPSGGWTPPADAQALTLDGRAAYYGEFLLHPEIPNHPVHPRWALAWQYEPGSWATVASLTQDPIPLELATHVVGQVEIGVGDALPANPPPGN